MPGLHTVQPREMQYDGAFHGVIDLYDENTSISMTEAWRLGVRGIIHQTSLGLFREDKSYKDRKDHAMRMGFLWGAYHVVSDEDAGKQLDRFLSHEPGDSNVLMAVDWEETSKGLCQTNVVGRSGGDRRRACFANHERCRHRRSAVSTRHPR